MENDIEKQMAAIEERMRRRAEAELESAVDGFRQLIREQNFELRRLKILAGER
jgi:hypothetical protein